MAATKGRIKAISISTQKGTKKTNVPQAEVKIDLGIEGDAHASSEWHRQVSLLGTESIKKIQDKGVDVGPGDFAENITTEGVTLYTLPIGTKMTIGQDIELEVSQIGKLCHDRCAIYEQAGDCVMPREGIFVKVIKGGIIKTGDEIKIL